MVKKQNLRRLLAGMESLAPNQLKGTVGFKTPKGSINASVMDFWQAFWGLLDGQFFPLTTQVQKFENIVENAVQRKFWLRSSTADGQVGQDKFVELFQGKMGRNPLP